MDTVLRTYALTAWTPADPLAGLEPELRRAILLMPSTFRERWKLAPWTNRHQRRLAITDIVAERWLLYELTYRNAVGAQQERSASSNQSPAQPTSPYYRYRLEQQHDAMAAIRTNRVDQDLRDIEAVSEAKLDHERRMARRQALLSLEIERAKPDVRELEILALDDPTASEAMPILKPKRQQSKSRTQQR